MVINSLETEVIQVIFDMTIKEYPMKRIVEYVKSLDVKTKQGRPINKYTQIKNMLTDIRYTFQIIRGKTYTKIEG